MSGYSSEGPLTHFQEEVLTIYKPSREDPWEAGPGQLLKMAAVWLEDMVLYSTRLGGTDLQSRYMEGGGRRLRSSGGLRPSWAPWDQASQKQEEGVGWEETGVKPCWRVATRDTGRRPAAKLTMAYGLVSPALHQRFLEK